MAEPRFRPHPVTMTSAPPAEMVDPDAPDIERTPWWAELDVRTRLVLASLAVFVASLPLAGLSWDLVRPLGHFFLGLAVAALVVSVLMGIDSTPPSTDRRHR